MTRALNSVSAPQIIFFFSSSATELRLFCLDLSYTRTYRHWSNENYYVAPTVQVWCGFDERDPFRAADVLYTVFKFELREDQRLEFDWRAFDSMASFLPSLEKVVFAFQREKDLARFRVKKTPELDCLCAAEKLRFVFWEENVAGWVHARPESGRALRL